MFKGFQERLHKDVFALAPPGIHNKVASPNGSSKFKIICQPDIKDLPFIGASVQASLEVFQQMWMTREQYEENGPLCVHKICF